MEKITKKISELRSNFNVLVLNSDFIAPNMYKSKLSNDLINLKQNTLYEELMCVSYHPKKQIINATVKIKQNAGYSGNECSKGSFEYVRFYIDYDRNGNWIDEGYASFNAHNLGFDDELCYNVNKKISPKISRCCSKKPVLPRVRAILSWNNIPPADTPDWNPYWGNVLERNIQVEPLHYILCHLNDITLAPNLNELDLLLKKNITPLPISSLQKSIETIQKNKIEAGRFAYKTFTNKIQENTLTPLDLKLYPKNLNINYKEVVDFILKPKFNTNYEELTCVSLNREMTTIHGTVHIKKRAGYSGDLCQNGSKEYIAFYMDFGNGWEYMNTSSVTVHNVAEIPEDGLDYNISLPVNLDSKRKMWCKSGKAKLKGILSWNVPPPANQPNHVSVWGDWEQCDVEIKPLPKGVGIDELSLKIETLGGMNIEDIDQLSGLATGPSGLGLSFNAKQSPFDGRINFTGSLVNGAAPLPKYRFIVHPPASGSYPLKNHITANKTDSGVEDTLIPDDEGWVDFTHFRGNYLGYFIPSASGLHTIEIQVKDTITNTILPTGNTVTFMAHKKAPEVNVEITSGSGNCGSFSTGDAIKGSYTAFSKYPNTLRFIVTPHPEASSGVISIDNTNDGNENFVEIHSLSYPESLNNPGSSGAWKLDTNTMPQCGYNIRLTVSDRTIMHSKIMNRQSGDIEGFCLIPKKGK